MIFIQNVVTFCMETGLAQVERFPKRHLWEEPRLAFPIQLHEI